MVLKYKVVRFFLLSLVVSLLFLKSAKSVKAATITVNPTQSLQTIVNNATNGDTINVQDGTYNSQITVSKSVSIICTGKCMVLGFLIKADNVVIKNFDITSTRLISSGYGIVIYNDKCLIENNYIHDTVLNGIMFDGASDNCQIINNRIYHVSQSGIEIRGTNHAIINNEIWNIIQYPVELQSDPYWSNRSLSGADSDGIKFFGFGHLIKGNYIHDIVLKSPEVTDAHPDCFQTWDVTGQTNRTTAHDITFDGNRCLLANDLQDDPIRGWMLASTYNLKMINNIIHARMISTIDTDVHDISFVNNTFVGRPDSKYAWGIYVVTASDNIQIQNNIFAYQENGTGSVYIGDSKTNLTLKIGNNCIFRKTGLPFRPADPGDIWNQDPLFVNYSNKDFHLLSTSPCIDKGSNLGVLYDFSNVTRPQGNNFDIGAYEYQANTTTPSPAPVPTASIKYGDANGDNLVNETDFSAWANGFLNKLLGLLNGDFNNDNKVDGIDYVVWLNNFGK